jgi:SRSO17 transposase
MTPHALKRLDRELTTFVETLTAGMGRAERRTAMAHYITGLLLDGERKSIEPMAARLVDDGAQIDYSSRGWTWLAPHRLQVLIF